MTMELLTDWFPPHIHPVREGIYQLLNTSTAAVFYARWIRQGWCIGSMGREDAARFEQLSIVQDRWQWRGIKEPA